MGFGLDMRLTNEVEAIAHECANLLIVYYTYVETTKQSTPMTATRFDLLRWQVHIRVMEHDLILRLCRLDDDEKTNHSLREALRYVRDALNVQRRRYSNASRIYRRLINPIKTKARNYYLAHLTDCAAELIQLCWLGVAGPFRGKSASISDSSLPL